MIHPEICWDPFSNAHKNKSVHLQISKRLICSVAQKDDHMMEDEHYIPCSNAGQDPQLSRGSVRSGCRGNLLIFEGTRLLWSSPWWATEGARHRHFHKTSPSKSNQTLALPIELNPATNFPCENCYSRDSKIEDRSSKCKVSSRIR